MEKKPGTRFILLGGVANRYYKQTLQTAREVSYQYIKVTLHNRKNPRPHARTPGKSEGSSLRLNYLILAKLGRENLWILTTSRKFNINRRTCSTSPFLSKQFSGLTPSFVQEKSVQKRSFHFQWISIVNQTSSHPIQL